ncbi:MAG: carbon storage regulator CsrA [Actinobacteria bacterium]|nr:MAG: carbon storage regulator CsrA [Actinomycetota bacterium]
MLVLTRKPKQSIMIGDDVEVTVLSIDGEKVRLGIQAPSDVPVHRIEIYMAIQQEHGEGGDREDVGSEVDDPLRALVRLARDERRAGRVSGQASRDMRTT